MKVKQDKIRSPLPRAIRNFLGKRKGLSRGIVTLVGVMGIAVLFFILLASGAHLQEMGYPTYFKNAAQRMANFDFSFVKNYTAGQLQELDDIQVDIKFKHLLRIRYLREQALKEKYISPAVKEEEFPAKMTLNGRTHNVKLSLTGLVAVSHLKDPDRWSFEVKVKGDDTFQGMKRFAMLSPTARGYLTDWLGLELMKERGLMGLRVDYAHVTMNGKPIGIYYMEERFDKYLVENNRLREGIVFKLDGELSAYQESSYMKDPAFKAQILMVKRMWQDVMTGNLPASQFFDMEKMAKAFVICDLMNNKHPLSPQNIRFYFNPVTGLAEPILREWEKLERSEVSELRLFLEKPKPGTRHFKFVNHEPVLKIIYDDVEFKKYYVREAEVVTKTKFLDQLLARNQEKIDLLLNKVYRTWPFYELPTNKLYENQSYMRSVLFPEQPQLAAYFNQEDDQTLRLSLHNQQYLPVEVTHVSWRDSVVFYPRQAIVLDTKEKEQPQFFDFQLPKRFRWSEDNLKELKVHYQVYGLESDRRTVAVLPHAAKLETVSRKENLVRKGNYDDFDFIEEDAGKTVLTIPAGAWTISEDLVIPAQKRLEIAAGAQIDLVGGAGIISYAPIFAKGQEERPVILLSSDSSSRGVSVVRVDQRSQLSHVVFDKLAGPGTDEGELRGAISFLESPVSIFACTFSNGRLAEDYLQILRSDFSIEHSLFRNLAGSALSAEYCTGSIANASFVHIGRNGLSATGSKLKAEHIFLNDIGAEALSAGENSRLDIRWADIRKADTGIAVIGQSEIVLADALIHSGNTGVAAYPQEGAEGTASIEAERLEITETAQPYQTQPETRIRVDGAAPGAKTEASFLDKLKKAVESD